jgi:hypothetical protein
LSLLLMFSPAEPGVQRTASSLIRVRATSLNSAICECNYSVYIRRSTSPGELLTASVQRAPPATLEPHQNFL